VVRRPLQCLLFVLALWGFADSISDQAIQDLESELSSALEIASSTTQRRSLKSVVRRAHSLISRQPDAAKRFAILSIVFQCQKELLVLKEERENLEALVATAEQLLEAPDAYATLRLEPEILLLQMHLQQSGATEHQQAQAIAELADRYHGTPAELDCLIVVAGIAFDLGHAELLKAFRTTLATRFSTHAKAIGFLRERFAYKSSSLLFSGRFEAADGAPLVLPIDRAGHAYLSCFWSAEAADLDAQLLAIKALQEKYAGRFDVLSFNLDELPDAGQSTLQALGLGDWRALHLPGGRNHELFRACSSNPDFLIRITNASGYVITTPIGSTYRTFGRVTDLEEYLNITMEEPQLHALIQSLRIGDFLVADSAPEQPALQACFVPPPMRYRLSSAEAMANYRKAATLAASSSDPWVRDRHIIALIGLWNLSGEPRYLRQAVALADAAPERLVARFCLAKAALRDGVAPDRLLAEFANDALSIGAAVVLSLDAVSPLHFASYRDLLLDTYSGDPRLWPLAAYCFDKFVTGRLFRGNYYASEVRYRAGLRDWQKDTETRPRQFEMTLQTLAGAALEFPHPDPEHSNVIVFLELPADEESAKVQLDLVGQLSTLASGHRRGKLSMVIAFLSEDLPAVQALAETNEWDLPRIAMVPKGIRNPHVLRLGIFLADHRPNTFMVEHDGRIKWGFSGLYHLATSSGAITRAVKEFTQWHDLATGDQALADGEYERALTMFEGSFAPDPRLAPDLKNAQLVGRSKAYRGLRNWEAALSGYTMIIDAHNAASQSSYCECNSLAGKLLLRAAVLDGRGKTSAAEADRAAAVDLACPPGQPRSLDPSRQESAIVDHLALLQSRQRWQEAYDYIDDIIVNNKDGRQAQREAYASALRGHAEILEQLGQSEQAAGSRRRAELLSRYSKARANISSESLRSHRYVDLIRDRDSR
jgi:hypothetical protein